jgi:hypothetical protein
MTIRLFGGAIRKMSVIAIVVKRIGRDKGVSPKLKIFNVAKKPLFVLEIFRRLPGKHHLNVLYKFPLQ